ncbi:citrate-binding protein [Cajanus cajan]|uniref:Citrate-binding protein n=1 Tax=Cajanus cajan TaxID=3821 RepID=A0A151TL97_CAJCA|nr:citrate-binding protein [Cajanus cajan]KYP67818.1 Citrate-binding protein [Cajanus cajan]
MGALYQIVLLNIVVYFASVMHTSSRSMPLDLTFGFTALPLNASNFKHHKPYNLPERQRYSFKNGVHKLWVYATDKPMSPHTKTNPRSEIRIEGLDYSSGVWQFEGQGFVPDGTSGVCVMQVFGAHPKRSTTLMLDVYDDSLTYYRHSVVVPNIRDQWFKLNVIHDVEASNVKIYVDGVHVYDAPGQGGRFHYFKFGVYAQDNPSCYMESRWKGIRVLRKSS